MICTPNAKFIEKVPDYILKNLEEEINSWNFSRLDDFSEQRIFHKFKSIVYGVSPYAKSLGNPERIFNVIEWCKSLYPKKIPIWANLFAMYPNHRYPAHVDGLELHLFSNRVHIPILSESGSKIVFFNKENESWIEESYELYKGGAWEINNIIPHSAENLSSSWRINFVIDMIDEDLMNSRNDWLKDNGKQMMKFWHLDREFERSEHLNRWCYKTVIAHNSLYIK